MKEQQQPFTLEMGKIYHVHVQGAPRCFEGVVIALTDQWAIVREADDHEQAFPIPAIETLHEFKGDVDQWLNGEDPTSQHQDDASAARMQAVKTLFPNLSDEVASLLAQLTDETLEGKSLATVLQFSRTKH